MSFGRKHVDPLAGEEKGAAVARQIEEIAERGFSEGLPNDVLLSDAQAIRKLLSIESSPPISEVIAAGLVEPMVKLVERLKGDIDSATICFEAAWALTNVASGTSDHCRTVIENGGISVFTELLQHPSVDVQEQACWALGNIAGDSTAARDMVISSGVCAGVEKIIRDHLENSVKVTMLRNAVWAASNFYRGKPKPRFEDPSMMTLAGTLVEVMNNSHDDEAINDACWAISYITDGDESTTDAFVRENEGIIPALMTSLRSTAPNRVTPALRAVGNLATGNDSMTQGVIDAGFLKTVPNLLSFRKRGIVKEAAWTLSNITAGSQAQIQAALDEDLFPVVFALLPSAPHEVFKELLWVISNALSGGSSEQHDELVRNGLFNATEASFERLTSTGEARGLRVVLEGLQAFFANGDETGRNLYAEWTMRKHEGLLDFLEALQSHTDEQVYEASSNILSTYFDCDTQDDADEGGPEPGGFQF